MEHNPTLAQKLSAETLGTATLALAIVGSGASADQASNSVALTLLINAGVTAAILGILIAVLTPISGAHFNPAVTLVMLLRRAITLREAGGYLVGQVAGALGGAAIAHGLFTGQGPTLAGASRVGVATVGAEVIATAGLVFLIVTAVMRGSVDRLPMWVGGWIGAGYFVTPSTGFANPAITIGRLLTDTFTGIDLVSVTWFVAAQLVGAGLGFWGARVLSRVPASR
jgi:glycerol uptake facilitator-like aquaporin